MLLFKRFLDCVITSIPSYSSFNTVAVYWFFTTLLCWRGISSSLFSLHFSNNCPLSVCFCISGGVGQHGSKSHCHRQAAYPEPLILPDQSAGERERPHSASRSCFLTVFIQKANVKTDCTRHVSLTKKITRFIQTGLASPLHVKLDYSFLRNDFLKGARTHTKWYVILLDGSCTYRFWI